MVWSAGLVWPISVSGQEGGTVNPPSEQPSEAVAQSEAAPVEEERPKDDLWTRSRLTGDWGGARAELEEAGLSFALYYNSYYGVNAHGGLDTNNAQRFSGSYDFIITVDFEKMGLIPGGKLLGFAQGFYGDSRNVNNKVGALADPFDDADGTRSIYVDQLWYQQTFWDGKARLRFGRLDQQGILDRNAFANSEDKQFMNTYLDNNNAIIPLVIGNGASLFLDPTDWLGFVIGGADAEARQFETGLDTTFHDGADFFGFFQVDFRIAPVGKNGPMPGNYRFGMLYDPGTKQVILNDLDGERPPRYETGDVRFYLSFDQMVYRESPADMQGLGLFARYGRGEDHDVNRLSDFWSLGLQYTGPFEGRAKDVLGLGMYSVHSSHRYRREIDRDFVRETGYELYYRFQVTPWLQITPDLQYITNPGALSDNDDAVVLGLRARVTF
ncbi:MAG: carbohydrate porin [bacterium]|nr:carbohydrate porin [bacterium]